METILKKAKDLSAKLHKQLAADDFYIIWYLKMLTVLSSASNGRPVSGLIVMGE